MRIGIFGAGAIGCYVGGRLAAAGTEVVLLGRESLVEQYQKTGMTVTDCDGFKARLSGDKIKVSAAGEDLRSCEVIIVTVKSTDTEAAALQLNSLLQGLTPMVVSLQNGVANASELERGLGASRVCAAMVPFNVVRSEGATFHRGTSGAIVVSDSGGAVSVALVALLNAAGVTAKVHANIQGVLWGKLVLNLNNALNALSGLPIRAQLERRDFRCLFAECIDEAIVVLKKAGIKPVATIGAPAPIVAAVLRLPNFLFFRIASTMLKIDPHARSSTWQDLAAGRKTEIDYLNGEILKLADKTGIDAPLNKKVVALIKKVETTKTLPKFSAADIKGSGPVLSPS